MTTTAKRKKLVDYMKTADDKEVRAIYTIFEDKIETEVYDFDKEFFKELDRRSKSMEDGTAKTYTWEETKKAAIDSLKAIRK